MPAREADRADQPVLYAENKFADARTAFNKLFFLLDNFQNHLCELAPDRRRD
jgi:hypothetical protein